jgi:NAD(P)-dependent dehydrogenase (short-subunit alcohol dehydrogenase family)
MRRAVRSRDLGGRVVVVTGAGRGIGRALAERFGAAGVRGVALLDVDGAALEEAREALAARGVAALARLCDVRDETACAGAIAAVCDAWGGVDVLVNNAGLTHRSLFAETDPAVTRRVMDVNFFGAVHMTRAALPSLVARQGAIAAISSVAGFAPLYGRTVYAASKHALHGFFDTLRAELAPDGVDVLLVCPSFVDTRFDARALAGDGSLVARDKRVIGRLLTPAGVADATVRALQRRRSRVVLSPVGRLSWWLTRLAPGLYARVMTATQRAEFAARP